MPEVLSDSEEQVKQRESTELLVMPELLPGPTVLQLCPGGREELVAPAVIPKQQVAMT